MADFNPPFSDEGEKRFPTTVEAEQGFQCGAGQRPLFNGLFHRIEAELGEVISFAGIVQSDEDLTQVRQAIEALIAAATGGGDTSQFLLVAQARARMLFFPETTATDGKIPVVAPSTGTVRVPSGYTVMHRGVFPINTGDTIEASRTFNTDASKIYHLRLNLSTGVYTLNDLANGTYNPGALVETDATFDSSYDNMLIARVVTNSSNVATITNLVNKQQLYFLAERTAIVALASYGSAQTDTYVFDFARKPRFKLEGFSTNVTGDFRDSQDLTLMVTQASVTRYSGPVVNATASLQGGTNFAFPYRYSVEA